MNGYHNCKSLLVYSSINMKSKSKSIFKSDFVRFKAVGVGSGAGLTNERDRQGKII